VGAGQVRKKPGSAVLRIGIPAGGLGGKKGVGKRTTSCKVGGGQHQKGEEDGSQRGRLSPSERK